MSGLGVEMIKHVLVSKTAVRQILKKEGKRISLDAFPQIEMEARALLVKAAKRAGLSGRKTVMSQDI